MTEPTTRLTIALLGLLGLISIVGLILLAAIGANSPQTMTALVGIATGSLGAIAGLINSSGGMPPGR